MRRHKYSGSRNVPQWVEEEGPDEDFVKECEEEIVDKEPN
jgi:hypothetical protein